MLQTEKNNRSGVDRLLEAVSIFKKSTTRKGIDQESAAQDLLLLQNGPMLSVPINQQMAESIPLSDNESGSEHTSSMLDRLKQSGLETFLYKIQILQSQSSSIYTNKWEAI